MGQVIEKSDYQVIETDDLGRLVMPAELLGGAKPHSRFVIETVGKVYVIQPEIAAAREDNQKLTFEEWQQQWKELQARMSQVWKTDKSAAEIVSEMRR